jgi:cytochrome c oxidase cbb3-type subunit 1
MIVAAQDPTQTTAPLSGDEKPSVTAEREAFARERALIDSSCRVPVLAFFATAVAWLGLVTALGLIAAIKLHNPEFLADIPFLTYGRVWPAYMASFTYGWASLTGMGVGIWLMARLCRVPIRYPGFLVLGAVFWNVGLGLGVVGLLAGINTGVAGMEIAHGPAWIMFIGYVFVGIWGAVLYRFRNEAPSYISVWYLLAAFFWFAWLFATAHILTSIPQLQGVMPAVVGSWYWHNLQLYWFTAIGLAAAYYLIPKVINRPVQGYNLASIGFWSFVFFGGLTAMVRLSGGPVPAWLVSVSVAASILLIVPIVTITMNLLLTMRGHYHMVYHSPTIRFTFFGAIAFIIMSLVALVSALRSVNSIVHFTPFEIGQQHLLLYAFYSMIMFGAIYYITPRLVGCEWLSATMIKIHFWGSAYGGALMIAMLLLAGLASGLAFNDPESTWAQIVQLYSVYMPGRTVGFLMMSIAHVVFGLHFLLMLLRIGQPGGQPTLFVPAGGDKH